MSEPADGTAGQADGAGLGKAQHRVHIHRDPVDAFGQRGIVARVGPGIVRQCEKPMQHQDGLRRLPALCQVDLADIASGRKGRDPVETRQPDLLPLEPDAFVTEHLEAIDFFRGLDRSALPCPALRIAARQHVDGAARA